MSGKKRRNPPPKKTQVSNQATGHTNRDDYMTKRKQNVNKLKRKEFDVVLTRQSVDVGFGRKPEVASRRRRTGRRRVRVVGGLGRERVNIRLSSSSSRRAAFGRTVGRSIGGGEDMWVGVCASVCACVWMRTRVRGSGRVGE